MIRIKLRLKKHFNANVKKKRAGGGGGGGNLTVKTKILPRMEPKEKKNKKERS